MATSEVVESIIMCPICRDKYVKPRTLTCQHSFCEPCLHTYIHDNAYLSSRRKSSFKCPTCRRKIEIPKTRNLATIAAFFPINPIIVSLVDNQKRTPCDCCLRLGENEDGMFWCQKCEDVLCKNCKDVHRKTKFTYTHDVETLEEKMVRSKLQKRDIDLLNAVPVLVTVVKQRDIGQRKCQLSGGAYLSDDRLIFANNVYNRDKYHGSLELFDNHFRFVKMLPIKGRPTDVAVNYTNNLICTVVNMKKISVFELNDDKLVLIHTVDVQNGTWGIAISPLGTPVTATSEKVTYRSLDDSVYTTIETENEFKDAYVAVSRKQQTLFYKEGNAMIKGVKLDGTRVLDYEHEDLTNPGCICLDYKDNIYVCGQDSNNIHQISKDGKRSRILYGIDSPYAIIFHPTKDTFVVTSEVNDNLFAVYNLE